MQCSHRGGRRARAQGVELRGVAEDGVQVPPELLLDHEVVFVALRQRARGVDVLNLQQHGTLFICKMTVRILP